MGQCKSFFVDDAFGLQFRLHALFIKGEQRQERYNFFNFSGFVFNGGHYTYLEADLTSIVGCGKIRVRGCR